MVSLLAQILRIHKIGRLQFSAFDYVMCRDQRTEGIKIFKVRLSSLTDSLSLYISKLSQSQTLFIKMLARR